MNNISDVSDAFKKLYSRHIGQLIPKGVFLLRDLEKAKEAELKKLQFEKELESL